MRFTLPIGAACAVAPLAFAPLVFGLASAVAEPLANGYDVSCVKSNDSQVVCTTSGCPRVYEDYAGDVIHTKVSGGAQRELGKACGNETTETVATSSSFDYGVQGCRKVTIGGDHCGAWANYHYEAPATPGPAEDPNKAAADQAAKDKAAADQAAADKAVADKAAADKAAAEAKAAEPVTDAITATITAGIGKVSVNVSNSSELNGKCTYDASPGGKHLDFNVPAHGSTPFSISGINTLTSYHVVINCTDASGKQSQPIGHAEQDVTF